MTNKSHDTRMTTFMKVKLSISANFIILKDFLSKLTKIGSVVNWNHG